MDERSENSVLPGADKMKQVSVAGVDPRVNEALADQIEKEFTFKLQRAPENIVTKVGLVKIIRMTLYDS